MTEALVELRGVRKVYGALAAVDSVDMNIARGEFVVLLGPSGSGKTTILSMLGGFVTPTEGSIWISGEDVTHVLPAKRPTVTVFQDYALFPHMSVERNVGFGLAMRKVAKPERLSRVGDALKMVGLEGFGTRGVHQLSGGQRQRVALARAIAVEPTVLLLDEPLGALDLNLRRQMQDELVRIQKQLGTTFVHVTHDQDEAMSIADTIVVLNHGRIEDIGAPDRVYLRPASLFTATFMGESNIIEGTVVDQDEHGSVVQTAMGKLPAQGRDERHAKVHLSIRPEQLRLSANTDTEPTSLGRGRVTEMVFQGTNRRCRACLEDGSAVELLLRLPVEDVVSVGQSIDIFVRRDDIVLIQG